MRADFLPLGCFFHRFSSLDSFLHRRSGARIGNCRGLGSVSVGLGSGNRSGIGRFTIGLGSGHYPRFRITGITLGSGSRNGSPITVGLGSGSSGFTLGSGSRFRGAHYPRFGITGIGITLGSGSALLPSVWDYQGSALPSVRDRLHYPRFGSGTHYRRSGIGTLPSVRDQARGSGSTVWRNFTLGSGSRKYPALNYGPVLAQRAPSSPPPYPGRKLPRLADRRPEAGMPKVPPRNTR